MSSIRRRTLSVVLLVFGISMLAIGWASYQYASHEIEELYDAHLAQNARLLEGLLQAPLATESREALLTSLEAALQRAEQSGSQLAGHRYEGKFAFQFWEGDRLLLRSHSAPEVPLTEQPAGYADSRVAEHDWRVYTLNAAETPQRIMVAERADVRGELTQAVAFRTLMPDLIGLPLLALLLWWAAGWGLRPLSQLAEQIRHRDPQALQPLSLKPLPRELETIVTALNRLLERIRKLREREKRFIADAAHELRTPLAVLDLHAQNAQAYDNQEEDRQEALLELRKGVARATRLVSQLLTLARLEPEEEAHRPSQTTHLLQETRETLAKLSPLATQNKQCLQLDADELNDWSTRAEPGAIDTLLQNLVGNALQHSPHESTVRVTLSADATHLMITVDDQGSGIPVNERERVTARFHRAGPGKGAGLGLSIVDRVVQRHGGQLILASSPDGGLRITATLSRDHLFGHQQEL